MFVLHSTRKKLFDMTSIIPVLTMTFWIIHFQKLLILFMIFYVLFKTISQIFKTYLVHRRAHRISFFRSKILVKHSNYDFLPSFLEVEIIYGLRIVHFLSFIIGRWYMIWKFTSISLLEILFGARDIIFWWSFSRKI